MKKFKKFAAGALAAVLAAGLAACGGSGEDAASAGTGSEKEKEYDQVVYAYATFNNIPSDEDLDTVEEAVNVITREKIGAEVTLKPISVTDYSSKVSLSLQGGEKLDIFQALGDFGTCISQDMALDITELLDECGSQTKELVGEEWLEACTSGGKIYGIPDYKPVALTPMFVYRQDIADELGIDMDSVSSVEDITAVLEQVKEAYPEMIPLAPVAQGTLGLSNCFEKLDYIDNADYPAGVLMNDELTIVDLYSTQEFKEMCTLARTWYTEGLVMKDAATTTSTAAECMASGNYFGYIASYSYPEKDTALSLQAQCGGYELGAKIIGEAYLTTSQINMVTWMIASTTDVPEAAMKFLNLTYTDEDIVNLLIYGIEGRDYEKNEDGTVSYPEGEDAGTVPYTAQLSSGTLGNYFLMYLLEGTDEASLEWELKQNQEADTSAAMGFSFDFDSLKTEYTAVKNVIAQYLPGLTCGSLDPETEIDKFLEALDNAGYQKILEEKQAQLDAWAAEKTESEGADE